MSNKESQASIMVAKAAEYSSRFNENGWGEEISYEAFKFGWQACLDANKKDEDAVVEKICKFLRSDEAKAIKHCIALHQSLFGQTGEVFAHAIEANKERILK